ncbi:MAG TPA: GTP 3',8-cyclase MoaA [Accumulibacter sp.]|nr:GTP 3',8-cyclase MoaA [Accumulibacter sp.]HND81197.1 GTP 3',8-cyclase MoaA [Accumulibacter sp.]HNE12860.1 GTP 3',8-cyclase MoaA [Accumulibacter sp.]HNL75922.1 GTP 3',8-cyclase MoaA [Accumulibacter sp.]HNO56172.1 GTP 3',8-cyclase MoaA [Accumulibacter sp.]
MIDPSSSTHLSVSSSSSRLIDKYGRQVTYLRLSITDRCDFRCHYCMAEEMSFLPRTEILTLEECLRLAGSFVALGVSKIRVTGGEPLVRQNVLWLLERLAALPGVRELVLTTNGSQLERYASGLRDAGVKRVNISLDTLRAERFRQITRIGDLGQVRRGIDVALAAGFERLKINTVLLRGVNDDELDDLIQFVVDRGMDIAFIEQMPLGEIGHGRQDWFSGEEALNGLRQRSALLPSTDSTGGPARYWRIPGVSSRVGFISPHTHNFCDSCNRVRVTARGELYPCLGDNGAVPLLPVLRQSSADDGTLRAAIIDALGIKVRGHDFTQEMARPQLVRFMSMTGG